MAEPIIDRSNFIDLFPSNADTVASIGTRLRFGWLLLHILSAIRLGVAVATINDKHFRPIKGLRVVRPY